MNEKQTRTELSSVLTAMAVGVLGSIVITLLLTALGAYFVTSERIGEGSINMIAVVTLVLSAAVGAQLAFSKHGHHRLMICLASGGMYYLVLLACTALLFDGMYQSLGITAFAILGGSGAAALLGLRGNRTGRKPRYAKHHNMKVVQNKQRGN